MCITRSTTVLIGFDVVGLGGALIDLCKALFVHETIALIDVDVTRMAVC